MTCAAPAPATVARGQEVAGESRTRRRSAVCTAIVGRDDLDVLHAVVPVSVVVFNPHIRKVHLVVEVRQVVLTRPTLDFLIVAPSAAVAARLVSIALPEGTSGTRVSARSRERRDARRPPDSQAFRGAAVGAIERRVVRHLARLPEAVVEHLPGFRASSRRLASSTSRPSRVRTTTSRVRPPRDTDRTSPWSRRCLSPRSRGSEGSRKSSVRTTRKAPTVASVRLSAPFSS